jgi:hypothetical protein
VRPRPFFAGALSVAIVLSSAACSSSSGTQLRRVRDPIARVSFGLPPGWIVPRNCCALEDPNPPRLLVTSFSLPGWNSAEDCFNAVQIVPRSPKTAVLVFFLEDEGQFGSPFPRRPWHFSLAHRKPQLSECVNAPTYRFRFRDAGRNFQAFVVVRSKATPRTRKQAMEVLDNFHVDRRE